MITATDIKNQGIKAIAEGLKEENRLSITVRGRVRYIVIKVEYYQSLQLAEMEMEYQEIVTNKESGQNIVETAEQHMIRLWKNE